MDQTEETRQPVNISYNKNNSSVSSFSSYLSAALNRQGSKPFYGLTLFLVIFSWDYANSVSCLENLVKLLELSHRDKNIVVPVFYGISRLAVKEQSGRFSDAFTELEMSYAADRVTKWRFALAETAELHGHEYNDKLSEESEFLEEIAQNVFEKLNPTAEIGIHKLQLDIENLLCKQPWGIRTLGILGVSGIGKTTLTRALHHRMSSGYDDSCFIENFHSRYSKTRLESLPDDFLCMTPMEVFDLNNSGSELCHRQKRVLVVLDDVRNAQDAKSFLGAADQFGQGSLIIISARDKSVLEQCQMNEIYELKGLNDEDALKLFTRCAFGTGVIEQKLLDLSTRMIESSDGNPSALISYAKELKGKTVTEMELALPEICHNAHLKLFEGSVNMVDACRNTMNNTSFCIISYGNDFEHRVLDTRATNRELQVPESVPKDSRLDHDSEEQSLPRNPFDIYQGFACQFHKLKLWRGYYKSFSMLKRIKLGHLVTLVEVEEISEARNLEEIDLRDCTSLESIPVTDKLKRLQVLDLSGCNGIKRFPDVVRTIRELNLEGTGITEIRSETTQYSKLVKQQSTTALELTQSL